MTDSTKKNVFEYRLHLNGIFGRNRKAKFDTFPICDSDVKLSGLDLSEKAVKVLASTKAKSGCKYRVVETPVTIEENVLGDNHYTTRLTECFSGVTVDQGVVP